ncbi:MAG: RDD family protein [Armatimonadaceae bacterium]
MTVCRHCGSANTPGTLSCFKCGTSLIAPHMVGKIPCSVHSNREATTGCAACGTRLCDACAWDLEGISYCEDHAPEDSVAGTNPDAIEEMPVLESSGAERASFFDRTYGMVVDLGIGLAMASLLALMVLGLAKWNVGWIRNPKGPLFITWLIGSLAMYLAYQIVSLAMEGRTVGRYMATVIILRKDGRIVPFGRAVVRVLASVLSALPLGLGYFWALWDPEGETWHDKISDTFAFRYQDTT